MTTPVRVTLQIGSECDGSQELIWSLRRQEAMLNEHRVIVPRPKFYRSLLNEQAMERQGGAADAELQNQLLYSAFEDGDKGRVVFSDTQLMDARGSTWRDGQWFPDLGQQAAWVRQLFPDAEFQFMIGTRNPANLLSNLLVNGRFQQLAKTSDLPDPFTLSWATLAADVRAHCPDIPLVMWMAEEIPFVWGQVLRQAAGLPDSVVLDGAYEPFEAVMEAEGLVRMQKYIAEREPLTPALRTKVIAAFLNKFGKDEAMVEELHIPGWTSAQQDLMEDSYSADIAELEKLDNVTLLQA